jgi:transcriptional regulator with GAF, ATPase, and Fis domain
LIESELFGHERGAFTGAATSRIGLLPMADDGTAFFDEIGELPLTAQVKLLRALQQQEVRPVGSNRTKKCSYRVIAATNRDLAAEVRKDNFRLDLYYRLNVVTLVVPPLRERIMDLPELIDHFLKKGGYQKRVPPEVLGAMKSHDWPGNVRELENCIARLVALSSDDTLHYEDLRISKHTSVSDGIGLTSNLSVLKTVEHSIDPNNIRLVLGEIERNAIERALADAEGSQKRAAKILGLSRTTLYRRIKLYEGRNVSR